MTSAAEGFNFDDEDDQEPADKNKSFADLRKAYNRSERDRKEFEKELVELREFRTTVVKEKREKAIESAFTEAQLNPVHSKLFTALNPEVEVEQITTDAVAKFAVEYGLATISGEEAETPEPVQQGYAPVVVGNSAPLKRFSRTEWEQMAASDPAAAEKAFKDGRVDLSGLRQGLGPQAER